MNIVFLTKSGTRRLNINLGPVMTVFVSVTLLFVCAGLFYSGHQYAANRTALILEDIRGQTESVWEADLKSQADELQAIKIKAENSLDAMAGRLSLLQGHVLRLDALGARLASMADLEDIEFGIDNPPGMGGPVSSLNQQTINTRDLLNILAELELKLQDRTEKLVAMESMLIDQTLQEQTSPAGRPTLGGWLSSLYGYRTDPMSGKKEFHQGIDFAGKPQTPITAVAAGIVTWSGPRYGYGNLVEVSHGSGYVTRYAHNDKNLVNVGEKVEKSEVIALMGSSGRSTGTHVHFEVVRYGRHVDPRKHISLK